MSFVNDLSSCQQLLFFLFFLQPYTLQHSVCSYFFQVYQYLISGNSSSASSIRCLEELPLPLCSVHTFTRGEPPFTNCTPDFTDTLDYIFFSPSDYLKPVSILELPVLDSPDVTGGLPNYSHPSDHLPIGAEFEITKD